MGRAIGRRLNAEGLRVELHDSHFRQGTPDADWLPVVGERGWIVLTKDTRIRYRPAEKQALLGAGVRAFAFTSGSLSGAQMGDAIVKALPKILALLASHQRAFVARITAASDVAILLEE
jgi:PIN like domain